MNNKHKLGILLAATSESIFTIGTMIANIKALMAVDIFYIVSDNFSKRDKQAIFKLAKESKVEFIVFTKDDFENKIKNAAKNPLYFQRLNRFLKRWTFMAFALFEGLKYLKECENIIYLDFDILLLRSLEHFKKFKKKGYVLAAHRGRTTMQQTTGYQVEYHNLCVYRSGIVLFNDGIKEPLKLYEELYIWFASNLLNCNDQAGLSYLIFKNHLKVKNLDFGYTGSVHYRANKNPHIIHAFGPNNRFWNNELVFRLWPMWKEYYLQWIQANGTPYNKGFVAKTSYGYERFRYHLSYKLGYIIFKNYTSLAGRIKIPFLLVKATIRHKREIENYHKIIQTNPHLKLPPLETYEDYKFALKEQQSVPYKLGASLISGCKQWHMGGLFKFFKEARELKVKYENKERK
ncbi:glycosyltransferase [Helicobacter burdigaliensis]|uniref:glycosyltransferase n=1 Tax=Helicobacter burdigaliensis TaxID=2315334 RepID=UPI000EF7217D|nr:glycosyltransferase [Helicobacter burdigaliensis]